MDDDSTANRIFMPRDYVRVKSLPDNHKCRKLKLELIYFFFISTP